MKRANGLGLHDMSGNVWEWVEDCAEEVGEGQCGLRVIRGGAWFNFPVDLRSSLRLRLPADFRNLTIGFRLAQDTP